MNLGHVSAHDLRLLVKHSGDDAFVRAAQLELDRRAARSQRGLEPDLARNQDRAGAIPAPAANSKGRWD